MPASEAYGGSGGDATYEYWSGADGCLTAAGCWAGGSGDGGAGSMCS